jgi:uncharacterized protein YcgI (DUF1989 family)
MNSLPISLLHFVVMSVHGKRLTSFVMHRFRSRHERRTRHYSPAQSQRCQKIIDAC